jgi:hypothetical protein
MDEESIQWRRVKWFEYVRRHFDIVSFGDLANWIAREAGSVRRDEADREQALVDLEDSIKHGEFGPADKKRCILWLPKPPPGSDTPLGQFCLRLNYGQTARMRVTADLYASRALCRTWLEARQIPLPPWLRHPEPPAGETVAVASTAAESLTVQKKPTLDQPLDSSTLLPEQDTLSQPELIVEGQPEQGPQTVEAPTDEPIAVPIGTDRTLVEPLRPIPRRRGPDGEKRKEAVRAMIQAVEDKMVSIEELDGMKQKTLVRFNPDLKRTALVQARKEALQQLMLSKTTA